MRVLGYDSDSNRLILIKIIIVQRQWKERNEITVCRVQALTLIIVYFLLATLQLGMKEMQGLRVVYTGM